MTYEWYQTGSRLSWHATEPGKPRALCGKYLLLTSTVHTERPAGKSCENCLRILERRSER